MIWIILVAAFIFLVITIIKKKKKKANNEVEEKVNKLNDPHWVNENPILAKSYMLDLQNSGRKAAVKCKITHGTYQGGCNFSSFASDLSGGWDLSITVKNNTMKTINYVDFIVTPIDRLNNVCCGADGKPDMASYRFTGPLDGYYKTICYAIKVWDNLPELGSVKTELITVTFADNTKQEIYPDGAIVNFDENGVETDI